MMYQGHLVNFSQIDDLQKRVNASVNLDLYKYPQNPYLASARSDSDVWKWIGQQIQGTAGSNEHYSWGANPNALNPRVNKNSNLIQALDDKVRQLISSGTGQGMTQQQVEQIVENYHGDDIALLYSNHADQEGRITDGFNDRRMIDAKANATQAEHGKFNDTLTKIGTDMTDLGKSLSGKAGVNHTHSGGGGKDCGWLGEKCWDNPFEKLFPTIPITAIVAAGGIAAYFLLKGKKK